MNTTHGIFVIDSLDKILIVHPTNSSPNHWSIPKGGGEEGETSIQSAIRETLEETNLDLNNYIDNCDFSLDYLGVYKYKHNKKQLSAWVIKINEPLSETLKDLKCTSYFEHHKTGLETPENDIVKWETFDFCKRFLHETQAPLIKQLNIRKYGKVKTK